MAKTRNTPETAVKSDDQAKNAGKGKEKSSTASSITNGNGNGNGNGDNGNGKTRCKSLIIDGTKYRTRLNQKFENRKPWEHPNPKMITSAIPGTIIKVDVKVGQKVKSGEQMLVLEAMKMKNKILFYVDGTVKSIHVKEGEKIPKDFLMLQLI